MWETWVWFLGGKDPLQEGNPLQYSGLENPMASGLQSMGSQIVGHDWVTKNSTADFKLTQHCKTTILQLVEVYSPWNSPGQNTGVDSLSPLQGIFPTQGSNPGLLHGRQILYGLSHPELGISSKQSNMNLMFELVGRVWDLQKHI